MNSQLYTAASGMIVERQRLDLIANNLANVSTSGYRAQRMFSVPSGGAGSSPPGTAVAGSYDVPHAGPGRQTGRPFDIALEDGEFLAVQTAAGRRYVRGGSLQLGADGRLTDGDGRPLLDSRFKPIQGLGAGATIAGDGRVMDGGGEVARLAVLRDPGQLLLRAGRNSLTANGRDAALESVEEPTVRAGWLEQSGTDALGELVRLIESQRAFESYQKLVSMTMNEVNRRAANDLAG